MENVIVGSRKEKLEKWSSRNKISPDLSRLVLTSVEEPEETPYLLEDITQGFGKLPKGARGELRNALLRVQVYCSIESNADPIKVSKQLFISQVLEKLLFGNNLLLCEEDIREEAKAKRKGR